MLGHEVWPAILFIVACAMFGTAKRLTGPGWELPLLRYLLRVSGWLLLVMALDSVSAVSSLV